MDNTAKVYVIGDIHGASRALQQCLERSNFNNEKDSLICLGDVCDGWPETRQSIDVLLGIKNLTMLLGNHDYWALKWMEGEYPGDVWSFQGGDATVTSYSGIPDPQHAKFLNEAKRYHLLDNKLFVHAGLDPSIPIGQQTEQTLLWDRELATEAFPYLDQETDTRLTPFEEVYIGHTPIHKFGYMKPVKACEVWFMDTGAGWDGCLSMMEINTKEIFTSDPIPKLYPDHSGRL